ncbi:unnamed protein product [Linum tenue]|uniref:AB hydrolase-1 domain-containing protein n=1 Tax=Linum tenue TaxID=586396 RepID=A0AAV0P5S7_9ROSI|nr:unnamed protein product [Linum tenue]
MEQLVNFIIRPPRAEYNPKHDLLEQEFMLRGKLYQRKDVEIKNNRGDVLQCTHYVPIVSPEGKPLPCVIYCHGNSGCRADASEAAIILLPSNITVFTLDFSGSGLSGGDHVTLGWYEKDDLKSVVDYLRQDGNVSLIGLWGRSMGAVTSLMYGAHDPSIAGMVLDSPFSDLVDLMMELVDTYKFRLPRFTVKFAIQYMRKAIQKKAKFDITDLNTIKVAKSCFVPALFGHGIEDYFIQPHHSDRIYEAYMGDKNIIKFEGDHNSPRPQFYFDSINIFFHNVLQPPDDEIAGPYLDTMMDYFGKHSWNSDYDISDTPESSVSPKVAGPSTNSSTEDAIKQVRLRRPMSRIEVPSDIPSTEDQSKNEGGETDDNDLVPSSSSRMISFELASNGNPYGPHVPTAPDDDQYVEYQLEDLSAAPSNAEEEERMLMEAIIASLKDMDVPANSTGTELSLSAAVTAASDVQTSDSKEELLQVVSKSAESTSSSSSSNGEASSAERPSSIVESTTTATSRGDTTSTGSIVETDLSGKTKATLTVERNPMNHNIMDGIMRRWDFSLFRNNR